MDVFEERLRRRPEQQRLAVFDRCLARFDCQKSSELFEEELAHFAVLLLVESGLRDFQLALLFFVLLNTDLLNVFRAWEASRFLDVDPGLNIFLEGLRVFDGLPALCGLLE